MSVCRPEATIFHQSLAGYSFKPQPALGIQLSSNSTQNFTATLITYTLTVSEAGIWDRWWGRFQSAVAYLMHHSFLFGKFQRRHSGDPNCHAVQRIGFAGWSGACQEADSVSYDESESVGTGDFFQFIGWSMMVLSPGLITTVAGTGPQESSGDGGPPALQRLIPLTAPRRTQMEICILLNSMEIGFEL